MLILCSERQQSAKKKPQLRRYKPTVPVPPSTNPLAAMLNKALEKGKKRDRDGSDAIFEEIVHKFQSRALTSAYYWLCRAYCEEEYGDIDAVVRTYELAFNNKAQPRDKLDLAFKQYMLLLIAREEESEQQSILSSRFSQTFKQLKKEHSQNMSRTSLDTSSGFFNSSVISAISARSDNSRVGITEDINTINEVVGISNNFSTLSYVGEDTDMQDDYEDSCQPVTVQTPLLKVKEPVKLEENVDIMNLPTPPRQPTTPRRSLVTLTPKRKSLNLGTPRRVADDAINTMDTSDDEEANDNNQINIVNQQTPLQVVQEQHEEQFLQEINDYFPTIDAPVQNTPSRRRSSFTPTKRGSLARQIDFDEKEDDDVMEDQDDQDDSDGEHDSMYIHQAIQDQHNSNSSIKSNRSLNATLNATNTSEQSGDEEENVVFNYSSTELDNNQSLTNSVGSNISTMMPDTPPPQDDENDNTSETPHVTRRRSFASTPKQSSGRKSVGPSDVEQAEDAQWSCATELVKIPLTEHQRISIGASNSFILTPKQFLENIPRRSSIVVSTPKSILKQSTGSSSKKNTPAQEEECIIRVLADNDEVESIYHSDSDDDEQQTPNRSMNKYVTFSFPNDDDDDDHEDEVRTQRPRRVSLNLFNQSIFVDLGAVDMTVLPNSTFINDDEDDEAYMSPNETYIGSDEEDVPRSQRIATKRYIPMPKQRVTRTNLMQMDHSRYGRVDVLVPVSSRGQRANNATLLSPHRRSKRLMRNEVEELGSYEGQYNIKPNKFVDSDRIRSVLKKDRSRKL
jgi:hypothetical protein